MPPSHASSISAEAARSAESGSRDAAENQRRTWLAMAALLLAGIVAYANSLSVPLLLDDLSAISGNASIRRLWPLTDVLTPPATAGVGGRPLSNLTFALNYAAGGTAVTGYHLVNLALHLAAAVVLFVLVRRTLRLPTLRGRFGAHATGLAFAAALIWELHPLQTEAVTYLSQRTEVLAGLFFFATLYGFVRSADSPRAGRWQTASVAACVLGASCKETIATAPLVVLLFDRGFVAGTFTGAWRARWRYYAALASTWVIVAWLAHDVAQRGVGFGFAITPWEYALTSCRSIVRYLALAIWPHPLVFDYGNSVVRRISDVWPQALVVVALLGATFAALRRWPRVGFLAAWFFLTLAPTTSFVPIAMQPIAEHRMFLPLAALSVGFALAGFTWLGCRVAFAAMTAAFAAATLTLARNATYHTELALWSDTVAKAPANARARTTLGSVLLESGRTVEAIDQFKAALQADPDHANAHQNLANALFALSRQPEAIRHYREAVRLRPGSAEDRYNLGNALLAAGEKEAAIHEFEAAAQLKFENVELHRRLGEIFVRLRRHGEAIAQFRAALAHSAEPGEEAADARAFELESKLAGLLAETGATAEAIEHYETALRLRPNDAPTHHDLGIALAEAGRFAAAREHLETALRLDPRLESARRVLEQLPAR